jgi:hypothetical protein
MLSLALAQSLHSDPRIQRCCSDAHSSVRCFDARGGGLEVGIALDCVGNERRQFRIVEGANPVRHHGSAAMRPGPTSRDLRTSRFRHDIRAKRRMLKRAARKYEARSAQKDSAIHIGGS